MAPSKELAVPATMSVQGVSDHKVAPATPGHLVMGCHAITLAALQVGLCVLLRYARDAVFCENVCTYHCLAHGRPKRQELLVCGTTGMCAHITVSMS